ncbi:Nif3-like dinuclear metal center hexameric protein [Croceivirga sp. JEA036]|uniref:Nif3-like dinuclear metal center hexameric protein n=1 Tax=Croceivirga sp. JEA036 TaxID=2721162 RepID=UPI00143923C3|nr:Nif3-like dinuclear metal center hexameric protein [Croceivirga sp. JEA036]NJB35993.1 Nif3-like dinuclear metal center hexameric protein [Croceivirga sp. JEA036]
MTVKEVSHILEQLAPLGHAEDFDNVGLLVGNPMQEVNGILVTLDTLENVVDEAIAKKCNLIVSFHPIIFSGLKKITGKTYVERVVMKALEHSIAIYSMHTALDNSPIGVNAKICEVLGVEKPKILIPKKRAIKKLVTYVPKSHAQQVTDALFAAGAGALGNYSHCSFKTEGQGSFLATEGANPTLGTIGTLHVEEELQVNLTFDAILEPKVLNALVQSHPYEEIAYEVTTLDNSHQHLGMGMVGELPKPIPETEFLALLKEKMNAAVVRHSAFLGKAIKKVAVLGGSGAFAIGAAKACGADIYITADLKYHQFYEAEGQLVLADIGHFETEQFTKNLLVEFLNKKIPNFAVTLSESITNPIKYY